MTNIFENKKIVIAVTGGVAAYKIPMLVRLLQKKKAKVKVIMSENATNFVSKYLLEVLTKERVYISMFDDYNIEHISLADESDFIILAPATANIIAKLSTGIADDLISTMLLAYRNKLLIVPSMNTNMYNNKIVQKNINFLKSINNFYIMESSSGSLACGYDGKGRMPEPIEILKEAEFILEKKDLKGKTIIISAGASIEKFDSVRYITNPSSGKMGYALAQRAGLRGANVILISSKNNLELPKYIEKVEYFTSVESAYEKIKKYIDSSDLLIMSAALGDYKFEETLNNKFKKQDKNLKIELIRTVDILKALKDEKIFKIGFAAESDNHEENAKTKLESKNLDMIALNDISRSDIAFSSDDNEMILFYKNNDKIEKTKLGKKSKIEIANEILDKYLEQIN